AQVVGEVVDAYTGEPVAGVNLTLGSQQATSDSQGAFQLPAATTPTTFVISPPDTHAEIEQEIPPGDQQVQILLRPTVLSGTITAESGDPLAGITVQAVNTGGEQSPVVETGPDGSYTLQDVPAGAHLVVEGPTLTSREV